MHVQYLVRHLCVCFLILLARPALITATTPDDTECQDEWVIEIEQNLEKVRIYAPVDVGYSNALYLTGSSAEIGAWRKFIKMNPVAEPYPGWEIEVLVPPNVEFKLLKGPWIGGKSTRSPNNMLWETGDNHIAASNNIKVIPTFE
ncbi:MAG: CBM20 domain-containing protein [Zetaproteobacteria bacterium]|nr:CBM20 domain-containing protein [Zetaproteobacteria bacterium]